MVGRRGQWEALALEECLEGDLAQWVGREEAMHVERIGLQGEAIAVEAWAPTALELCIASSKESGELCVERIGGIVELRPELHVWGDGEALL